MNRKHPVLSLVVVLGAIALILIVAALMLPAISTAREAPRRYTCQNNLKDIALALLNYHHANGDFPPAYTVDDEGNRLHSWRTLILPYIEEQALYDSIDLSKPWDDPANAEARKGFVKVYRCPKTDLADGMTTYLGVVGPGCFFSGSEAHSWWEFSDGTSNTIMVVDAAPGSRGPLDVAQRHLRRRADGLWSRYPDKSPRDPHSGFHGWPRDQDPGRHRPRYLPRTSDYCRGGGTEMGFSIPRVSIGIA